MKHKLPAMVALPAVLLLLGACASKSESPAGSGTAAQQQALARYTQYAGPQLPYFTWLGRFWSWEPLSKDQLVVWTTANEAYLLKVWPPCDLRFAGIGIGISSTASSVYARMDSIVLRSGAAGPMSCPIDSIRKIDVPRMRAEQHTPPPAAKPTEPASPAPANPTPGNPSGPANPTPPAASPTAPSEPSAAPNPSPQR
jgi:hypothetical protein